MNPFRANKNWLRYLVISQMRENHKELFDPIHKSIYRKFANYISESKQWWVVLLFVSVIFLLSPFINIELFNFLQIDPKSAIIIVDQRTANIATIISITLVVVGFILNNLAVKSPLVYRILFKKSFLYPIIYFTLSTIACFIIISMLRDSISPFNFARLVIAGTYLSIAILFLIGLLFRTILLFSNEKIIAQMLHEELMKEVAINIKHTLIQKYSREHYFAYMKKLGIDQYNEAEAWAISDIGPESINIIPEKANVKPIKEKIINNIGLRGISRIVLTQKGQNEIYFKPMYLEYSTTELNNFILTEGKPFSKWVQFKLRQCLITKIESRKVHDTHEMRNYFDQKLEELSEQGQYRNLEVVLDSYLKLYEFQMQHQK